MTVTLPSLDSLVALLHRHADVTLVAGRYSIATLRYLVQRLSALVFDGAGGALLLGASDESAWHGADVAVAEATVHRLPLPGVASVFACAAGKSYGFVLCAEATPSRDGGALYYHVWWSYAPKALQATLTWLEQPLAAADLIGLRDFLQGHALQFPAPERLLRLNADLLDFNAAQEERLTESIATLEQRARWQQDQTRMLIHDLRSPLHTLALSINALLSQLTEPAQQREVLHVAYDRVQYLLNLTETVVEAARLENHRWVLKLQPIDVAALIHAVCEPLQRLPRVDQPALTRRIDPDLPLLMADRLLIERVLTNLIVNAIKYTPPTGAIIITARHVHVAAGAAIELQVSDTGRGIALEAQTHIFERFFQSSSGDQRGGVGLGLYFCRLAVEAHGGTISVVSSPGIGSAFTVVLPLRDLPVPPSAPGTL